MRRLATTTWLVSISLTLPPAQPASASDIVWEVQSPFRFFKKTGGLHAAREGVRGGARQGGYAAARQHRVAHRAPAERSGLRRQVEPRRAASRPRARVSSARASAGPRRRSNSVCYERNSRPFRYHGGVRPAIFLGHREGRLRPARRPHGGRDALGRAPRRGRHRRLHLRVAAARRRRQGRDRQAVLQEARS